MTPKSKTLKTPQNQTDEIHDAAAFVDCVKFLHTEAERLGFLKLAKILEGTVDSCAKAIHQDADK